MAKPILIAGALFGAAGVLLGAFGAHGLKARLGDALAVWETAVTYHLVHALALVAVAALTLARPAAGGVLSVAAWAFAAGIVLFSGSLYALALGGPKVLGPVTPLGGVAFIVGWLALAAAAWR